MIPIALSAILLINPAGSGSKWSRSYFQLSRVSIELPVKATPDPPQTTLLGKSRVRIQTLRFAVSGINGIVMSEAYMSGPCGFVVDVNAHHARVVQANGGNLAESQPIITSGVAGRESVIQKGQFLTWIRTYVTRSFAWDIALTAGPDTNSIASAKRIISSIQLGAALPERGPARRTARAVAGSKIPRRRPVTIPAAVKSAAEQAAICRDLQLQIAQAEEEYRRYVKDDRFTTDLEDLKRFMGNTPKCPGAGKYEILYSNGRTSAANGTHAPAGALIIRCAESGHGSFTPYLEDSRPNSRFDSALEPYCRERRHAIAEAAANRLKEDRNFDTRQISKLFPKGSQTYDSCPMGSYGYAISKLVEGDLSVSCSAPSHKVSATTSADARLAGVNLCRVNLLKIAEAQLAFESGRERTLTLNTLESLKKQMVKLPECPESGRYSIDRSIDFQVSDSGFYLPEAVPMVSCSAPGHGTFAAGIDAPIRGFTLKYLEQRRCWRHHRVMARTVNRILAQKARSLASVSLSDIWQNLGHKLQCPLDGQLKITATPELIPAPVSQIPPLGLLIGCTRHGEFNPGAPFMED